jgi:hypothetical protein
LEIENLDDLASVENVFVDVEILDAERGLATDRFAIGAPVLAGLTAVDGTGVVAPHGTGTATWLIVPTHDAAPLAATQYFVGGVFSYSIDGLRTTIPLSAVPITVKPDPSLTLAYFWQRDVFPNDPFTQDVVEPSEPFSLGLLMSNKGHGTARNVRVTSAQPQII